MEQAQKNAFKIAEWLKTKSAVIRVIYPGLPDHPGYEIMKKQARGFGSMLTFQLESTKRLFNPHKVDVDLSRKLYDEKQALLNQMSIAD